jgi:hypothetical protein
MSSGAGTGAETLLMPLVDELLWDWAQIGIAHNSKQTLIATGFFRIVNIFIPLLRRGR